MMINVHACEHSFLANENTKQTCIDIDTILYLKWKR